MAKISTFQSFLQTHQHTYHFEDTSITLVIPDEQWLQKKWKEQVFNVFPFWGKSWPAAEALAGFLVKHHHYVQDKRVLELAAGLGLPSLVAARFAGEVTSTDYLKEPLKLIKASAQLNHIANLQTGILNWHDLPDDIDTDVLLLSDVNYDPTAFEALDNMLEYFISKNVLVILSTPQRIMAKSFIEKWMPYQKLQEEQTILHMGEEVRISTMILSK